MTTRYEVPKDLFAGKTVAVLATGPSMNQALADSVKQYPRIAVRRAMRFAPDADMLVAIDGRSGTLDDSFWDDAKDFKGLRITGTESEALDALYVPMPHEVVTLRDGHTVHIRNNGLAAVRIAAQAGASKILLLGFDTERYEEIHARTGFRGLTAGLSALTAELQAQGIEVERVTDTTERKPVGATVAEGAIRP
jgi:hypothetical protein